MSSRAKMARARREQLRAKGLCVVCGLAPHAKAGRCGPCYRRQLVSNSRWAEKVKREAMAAYGGPVCACCGERHLLMLTIDHVAQDGARRRKAGEDGTGCGLYAQLRGRGFPPGYRVLCRNCNFAVYFAGDGRCPHRTGCFADPP